MTTITRAYNATPPAQTLGAFAAADSSTSCYFCAPTGPLVYVTGIGTTPVVSSAVAIPSGEIVTGIAIYSGNPYLMTAAGALIYYAGGWNTATTFSGTAPWLDLAYATNWYACAPGYIFEHVGGSTPTDSSYAVPASLVSGPHSLATDGTNLYMAWEAIQGLSITGSYATAVASTDQVLLSEASGISAVTHADYWSAATALSMTPTGKTAVYPDGSGALVPLATQIAILANSGGTWTNPSDIAGVTNVSAISIAPSGSNAMAVSSANGLITPLAYSAGSWTTGTTISVTAPSAVAVEDSVAVVGGSANLYVYTLSGSTWSLAATLATSGTPSSIAFLADGVTALVGYSDAASLTVIDTSALTTSSVTLSGDTRSVVPYSSGAFLVQSDTKVTFYEYGLVRDAYAGDLNDLAIYGRLVLAVSSANTYGLIIGDATQLLPCPVVSVAQMVPGTPTWSSIPLSDSIRIGGLVANGTTVWAADAFANEVYEISFASTPTITSQSQAPANVASQFAGVPAGLAAGVVVSGVTYFPSVFAGGVLSVS